MESNGMVMCASNKPHTECLFLRPAQNTKNGGWLILKGHPPKGKTEGCISNNNLKKFLELLRTDEYGRPCFGYLEIVGEDFEMIPSKITNGNIS